MTSAPAEHTEEPERRRRGRPSQIALEQVIEAAVHLGLERITVQAVADHLGVTRAAVYYYVSSTEELRRLAAHRLLPAFEALTDEHGTWQDWIRSFAGAARQWRLANADVVAEVSVPMSELPSFLVVVDEGIGVLTGAGFSVERAGQAVQFIGSLVWINAHDEAVARRSPEGRHPQGRTIGEALQGELALRHIPADMGQQAFGHPEVRFQREIEWAIRGLESDLAESGPRRSKRRKP